MDWVHNRGAACVAKELVKKTRNKIRDKKINVNGRRRI
jgi:hypothetical protein